MAKQGKQAGEHDARRPRDLGSWQRLPDAVDRAQDQRLLGSALRTQAGHRCAPPGDHDLLPGFHARHGFRSKRALPGQALTDDRSSFMRSAEVVDPVGHSITDPGPPDRQPLAERHIAIGHVQARGILDREFGGRVGQQRSFRQPPGVDQLESGSRRRGRGTRRSSRSSGKLPSRRPAERAARTWVPGSAWARSMGVADRMARRVSDRDLQMAACVLSMTPGKAGDLSGERLEGANTPRAAVNAANPHPSLPPCQGEGAQGRGRE